MILSVRCPHCKQVSRVDDSLAGQSVTCPICGKQFSMPHPVVPPPTAAPPPVATDISPPLIDVTPRRRTRSARTRSVRTKKRIQWTPLVIALIGAAISIVVMLGTSALITENESSAMGPLEFIRGIAAFWFVGVIYFFPTLVALHREVRQIGPIALVNLTFGWVFIGWFIAMAWALSSTRPLQVTHVRDRPER